MPIKIKEIIMDTKKAPKGNFLATTKGKVITALIAAVVVFSCLATVYAVANIPKEVTILDGNKSLTIQTNESEPANIIEQQGIKLGENDVLDDTQFDKDNSVLILKREMTVYFTSAEGKRCEVTLPARTVADVLAYLGVELGEGDAVEPQSFSVISQGAQIRFYEAGQAKLVADGEVKNVGTNNKTVMEILREEGISLGAEDYTIPALDTIAGDGDRIQLVRVTYKQVSEQEEVKPETVYKTSASIPFGMTQLYKKGKAGKKSVDYKIKYENGKPVAKEEVSSTVLVKAQDEIMLKGSAKFGTGKKDLKEKDLKFSRKYTGVASAYTAPKGAHCANGMEAAVGRVGVNPDIIPFGTKLYITGYGFCVAADTGPGVISMGRFVDLYMNSVEDCMQWGLREVTVYVLE